MKSTIWLNLLIGFFSWLASSDLAFSQEVTLQQYYKALQVNYPLTKNAGLVNEQTRVNNQKLHKGFLPQLQFSAQATYQNEVTTIGGSGASIPSISTPSKDQYKATLSLQQNIYDGGNIAAQENLNQANGYVSLQQNVVNIYQIKRQVSSLFFQALLIDQQKKIDEASLNELQVRLKAREGALKFGTAQAAEVNALKAEVLRVQQQVNGLLYDRKTVTENLNTLTGLTLNNDVVFTTPDEIQIAGDSLLTTRPEYELFKRQKAVADAQIDISKAGLKPKLSLIGEENYGRPGYNFLRNDFGQFWLVGAKVTWNISGFYSQKQEKKLAVLNKQQIDVQRDIFKIGQAQQLTQQRNQIDKLKQQLSTDQQIIDLRVKVRIASAAKLDNGTATTTDYLVDMQSENEARYTLALHETQLQQAYEEIKLIQGSK